MRASNSDAIGNLFIFRPGFIRRDRIYARYYEGEDV
jgi:hypothetical protein